MHSTGKKSSLNSVSVNKGPLHWSMVQLSDDVHASLQDREILRKSSSDHSETS